MSAKREIGTPSNPVAPSGAQVPEPQLWPLLYDLNATVSRIDEAVSGLKDRVNSLDSRIEDGNKDVKELTKQVSSAHGGIKALTWVVAVVMPVTLLILEILVKRFHLF
jgi:hypothetical protein